METRALIVMWGRGSMTLIWHSVWSTESFHSCQPSGCIILYSGWFVTMPTFKAFYTRHYITLVILFYFLTIHSLPKNIGSFNHPQVFLTIRSLQKTSAGKWYGLPPLLFNKPFPHQHHHHEHYYPPEPAETWIPPNGQSDLPICLLLRSNRKGR